MNRHHSGPKEPYPKGAVLEGAAPEGVATGDEASDGVPTTGDPETDGGRVPAMDEIEVSTFEATVALAVSGLGAGTVTVRIDTRPLTVGLATGEPWLCPATGIPSEDGELPDDTLGVDTSAVGIPASGVIMTVVPARDTDPGPLRPASTV